MTNQEKLNIFAAKIQAFINSENPNSRLLWNRSGIARLYRVLYDELSGDDLTQLHTIAMAAVPQLNPEFGAILTMINER